METMGKILRNINKDGLVRLIHFLAKRSFRFWEKYFSLHIVPAHFFSPIPVTYELDSGVFEKYKEIIKCYRSALVAWNNLISRQGLTEKEYLVVGVELRRSLFACPPI